MSGNTSGTSVPVDQSLQIALQDFQRTLNPEQKQRLWSQSSNPDASAAIILTAEIDNENAKRKSRCVAARILSFLESVQQFCSVVDTFVTSNPRIAALVWGSVKLVVLAASNFSAYFDKLSTLLMNLRNYFPRYSRYQILYSRSPRLQEALCTYYATVVNFCKKVLEISRKSGFLHAASSLIKPFEVEFGDIRKRLEKQNQEIEHELDLAEREAAVQERGLQERERESAKNSRQLVSLFRKRFETETDATRDWRKQVAKQKLRKKRQTLMDNLSSYDYKRAYRQACRKRHGTTGSWIRRRPELDKWISSPESSVFWCGGIPGSGKTVLTASIIGELFLRIPTNISGVRFFFCEYDRPESLKAATILSSLIKQCLDVDNMTDKIEDFLESATQDPSDTKLLGELLHHIFTVSPQQCVVIDAIDECSKEERRMLLDTFQGILSLPQAKSKLFLIGGLHLDIELNRVLKIDYHLSMSASGIDGDIRAYIESVLAENISSGDLVVGDPNLVNDIQDALVKEAKGMFLWVAFQIQDICSQKCDEDIRSVINDLPVGLSNTYERALRKVNSEKGTAKWAQKIFRWVAAAKQPLALEELREATAIKPGQPSQNTAALINDINQLVPCCRNLVVLDEEEKVVQFAHHTVKKFLLEESRDASLGNFHFQLLEANHEIGEICVTYLSFTDLKRLVAKLPSPKSIPIDLPNMLGKSLSEGLSIPMTSRWLGWLQWARANDREADLSRLMPSIGNATIPTVQLNSVYALLPYASQHWLHHSSDFSKAKTKTWSLWNDLLNDDDNYFKIKGSSLAHSKCIKWIVQHEHFALLEWALSSASRFTECVLVGEFLRRSAEMGLSRFVRLLIESHEISTSTLQIVLQPAIKNGHLQIVDILLRALSARNPLSPAPLSLCPGNLLYPETLTLAAGAGNFEVTQILLEAGGCPDAGALLAAAKAGDGKMFNLLQDSGASVEGAPIGNSLREVAAHGYSEILHRLLQQVSLASFNSEELCKEIELAAECGYHEIVERLLELGGTAFDTQSVLDFMMKAVKEGELKVLDRILEVEVESKSVTPTAPILEQAIQHGDIGIVDRLLNAGADANAVFSTVPYSSAIVVAAESGSLQMVNKLLEAGAKITHNYGDHYALEKAAKAGNLEVIKELIEAEVENPPGSHNPSLAGVFSRFVSGV
ncbi:hypothetical protein FQN54_008118 [Arachnomyces sp. PD_36]|nr:hypothetical protein FQN54_008118 [Arachnomyces sp. PD_36]